ncbi:MAG: hypothetical protein OEZ34_05745, partial [Spirochaetia bacterium]|nr:hypothetical protein [Spirochaetia bacterium]
LSDADLNTALKNLGLSQEGSRYQKQFRLRQALGTIDPPSLPSAPSRGDTEIENASEGEFLKGDDDKQGLLILRGRIRVRTKYGRFYADTVIIDSKRKEIYGEGNIVFRSADAEIRGERIIIDQKLGTGIIYNAEGFYNPVYFIGPSVVRTSDQKYAVSHAHFTTCAARRPHYNFSAKKIWIHEGEKLVAVGVIFRVGGVPLLPLPFLYLSDWGTGIVTQVGHGDLQGTYMQNTYQFSIPSAQLSKWQPMAYRFKADVYQNTGGMGGLDLIRFSPNLNYFITLEGANFKRYSLIGDYRAKDKIRTTNFVKHKDGTYGKEIYRWHKIFAVINHKSQNLNANRVSNVNLRYEDYSHRLYEFEFGGRDLPDSTIPAIYKNSDTSRGLLRNNTNWNLTWNESIDDLNVRVFASRDRLWLDDGDFEKSRYVPLVDILPSIDITKKANLFSIPFVNAPLFLDTAVHSDVTREYSSGLPFRSINTNRFTSGLRTYLSFYPWVTFQPSVGYGAQKTQPYQNPTQPDASLDRYSRLRSYEFYYSEDILTFGPDVLFLEGKYKRKDSFNEDLRERPVLNVNGYENNQKVNETEVKLETNPFYNMTFSLESVYDHRRFEYDVKNKERWHYPIFRTDIFFDFINSFRPRRENLLARQKLHFLGIRFTNDLIYDAVFKDYHSNVLGINFQAGGFDLWLLKRLRYFEAGFYWYHVYYDPALDHMRYTLKMDVQITRNFYFEMELESRATEIERYSKRTRRRNLPPLDPYNLEQSIIYRYYIENFDEDYKNSYVPVHQDIANGSGINGAQKRQEAVFNAGYYRMALIMDLHDWELAVGYSMEQRTLYTLSSSAEYVNFYDNKVFISATLLRFDFQGIGSRPSRFIINRRRVRASDVGSSSIGSERIY